MPQTLIEIEDALVQHVVSNYDGVYNVNYENTIRRRTLAVALDLTMFPGSLLPDDLGDTNEFTGIFQISVVVEHGAGAIVAKSIRDDVAAIFPMGKVTLAPNISIDINGHSLLNPVNDKTHYKVPLRVIFTAQVTR